MPSNREKLSAAALSREDKTLHVVMLIELKVARRLASEQPQKEKDSQQIVIRGTLAPPTEAAHSRVWIEAVPPETPAAVEVQVVKACPARVVVAEAVVGEEGNYGYGTQIIK